MQTGTYEQWEARGHELLVARNRNMWAIGDWLNEGERKWGEMYAQAHDDLLISARTLANYAWVARAYEAHTHERTFVDVLSFSHHKIAAGLDGLRGAALTHAYNNRLNCAEFQVYVNELKGTPAPEVHHVETIGGFPVARKYKQEDGCYVTLRVDDATFDALALGAEVHVVYA